MIFTSGLAPKLYAPGITRVIVNKLKMIPQVYSRYLHQMTSDKQFEKFYSMFGIFDIPSVGENENYQEALVTPGFEKIITPLQYALVMKYGLVAKEDEQYGFLRRIPSMMTDAMTQTIEALAANVLNNAATTLGSDGVYLAALTHPALDGTTHANTPSSQIDLSYSAVETALITMGQRKNHEGDLVSNPKPTLFYHPANMAMVDKLSMTSGMPFSGDNTVNFVKGKFTPLEIGYLSDEDMWGFLTPPNEDGGVFVWRVKPSIKEYTDNNNDATGIRMRFRCIPAVIDWRAFLQWFSSGNA